ncbi:MAG: hypothetical protein KJZ80_19570 [Hyphomicrobiaceae bacterium]|nr:hypothetical protein [Hyphomicrobiaceae bacterium]
MKKTVHLAVLCLGTGLALSATAQAQQGQQLGGQQMGQQQFGQQMPGQMPGQMLGQQTQLTEQRIRNFFKQAERVLQQTARSQDPGQLQQYLDQFLAPDATITSASELYFGDTHVATTIAHISDETVIDALGHAATALQGRKLVSDYDLDIRVRNVRMMPGNQAARVTTVIQETGVLGGPAAAPRVAQAPGQQLDGQQQWGQQGQQPSFGAMGGQPGQRQQGWGQMQNGQFQQGTGMGFGAGRGGAPEQGVRFQTRATCIHDVGLEQGQIRIGNTFCRGAMRLG